jgi:hypothetical protein
MQPQRVKKFTKIEIRNVLLDHNTTHKFGRLHFPFISLKLQLVNSLNKLLESKKIIARKNLQFLIS